MRLPEVAVYVVHLEDPPGSGLAACCGYELPNLPAGGAKWLCTGCANAGKPRERERAALEGLRAEVAADDEPYLSAEWLLDLIDARLAALDE